MAERSSISEVVQIGVESVSGTAVAATKQLLALSLSPAVQLDVNQFQPKGGKYPTIIYAGREWAASDVAGDATYSEIQYPLASVVTTPTVAQILDGATPTTAYRWTFAPLSFGADTPKTFTVEEGGTTRAHRSSNFLITSFDIDFDRKGVTLGGSAYGAAIEDGITLTSSGVTSIPTVPIQPTQVSVYMDNTVGALGTTKLLRVLKGQFHIADRYNPLFVVDAAQPSFVASVETDPNPTFKLTVEADAAGMAMLTALRTGATRFLRLRAVGPKLYTGGTTPADVYAQFTIDMAGKVSAVSKFSDSDGVYAIEFTFSMVHDSGWGKAFTVELINSQSAL